jgi:hypothetical protein
VLAVGIELRHEAQGGPHPDEEERDGKENQAENLHHDRVHEQPGQLPIDGEVGDGRNQRDDGRHAPVGGPGHEDHRHQVVDWQRHLAQREGIVERRHQRHQQQRDDELVGPFLAAEETG